MALVTMYDKLAVMPQGDATVTLDGESFLIPAGTPFTTSRHEIEIQDSTVLAIMYNATSTGGDELQVFSFDAVMTVA